MVISMDRYFLYKAVKFEVENFRADHGFSLVRMWDVVNGRTEYDQKFWERECIRDFIEQDLYDYLKKNYTGPDKDWPNRWWEPGAEDAPKALPEDQWLPNDEELPFE